MIHNATHMEVVTVSIPNLLKLDAAHHLGVTHRLDPIPAVVYEEALRYYLGVMDEDGPAGILVDTEDDEWVVCYINSDPADRSPLTQARVSKYRAALAGKSNFMKIDRYEKVALSINEVTLDILDPNAHPDLHKGSSCDCSTFWSWLVCPHLLACQQRVGLMDIYSMMKPSHPPNRKRLKQSEK